MNGDAETQRRFHALVAEGLTQLPAAEDWAELTAKLRMSREIVTAGTENHLPTELAEIELSLRVLIDFLQKQKCLMDANAVSPLFRLNSAIIDLGDGIVSSLFKPSSTKTGRPGKSLLEAGLIGFAAKTMSLLIEEGHTKADASNKVALAMRANGGAYSKVNRNQVAGWRDRIHEGPGGGRIPEAAIEHYNAPWPAGLTATWMLERLKSLRARGVG